MAEYVSSDPLKPLTQRHDQRRRAFLCIDVIQREA